MVFDALESKWLKKKLAENAYTFSEHLDASSRYIAAKAPKVMPTSGVARSSATLSADAIDQSLRDGGSWNHSWDKSAGCKWNPVYCKI